MKPRPFVPEPLAADPRYVRDRTQGLVWHQCPYRTLYADTDRSGVVYHANYLRYFEVGRTTLMRDAAYPYREIEESGFVYPIIQVGVDYFSSLRYDDLMVVHTRPGNLERVKLCFDYLITHGDTGEIVCRGFTRHCATNRAGIPVGVDARTLSLWDRFPA
ncbi:acyl-CoA thioesterase [Desulfococcus sp.]|uniref:acyl-CoA thioesterase n=1 Tax=Desulfococcus sp. TaxID=2025834 RepID=UPI003593E4DC